MSWDEEFARVIQKCFLPPAGLAMRPANAAALFLSVLPTLLRS
jgi:hypothetical protein